MTAADDIRLPSLEALRALDVVARLGSFERAADALAVSASAVGKRIAALESLVGADLLQRDGRRLVLTDRASGYSLALTATVSPLNGAGRDVKAVLALLATAPALAAAPAAPTDGQG